MVLDIIIILLIASGFYWGYSKGIIHTLFAILSIGISLVIASKFATNVADLLIGSFNFNPKSAFVVGMMILFFASLIAVRFLGTRVEAMFKALNINFVNKVAGGVLMGSIFLLLTTTGVRFLEDRSETNGFVSESSVYPIIAPLGEATYNVWLKVQPELKKYQETVKDSMQKAKESSDEYLDK